MFCNFIFTNDKFEKKTFIAHNGAGYDVHFVMRWLFSRGQSPSFIPSNGKNPSRIIEMKHLERRFIDSLAFIDCPLSGFGKAFGLEITKGYFPHEFNTTCRQNYKGIIPDKKYYGLTNTKCNTPEDNVRMHEEFDEWYEEERMKYIPHTNKKFVLQEELAKYCLQDVEVLRQGCMSFRHMFTTLSEGVPQNPVWNVHDVDPFQYLTISSLVINLAIGGFNESHIAHYPFSHENLLDSEYDMLKHYFTTQKSWAVGRYEKTDATIISFEVYGPNGAKVVWMHSDCYDVGCPDCHPDPFMFNVFRKKSADECWSEYQRLRDGYGDNVYETFSHTVQTLGGMELGEPLHESRLISYPLHLRDGLYGGRTELFQMYVGNGQRLCHIDVCSLYPTVCAYDPLPIGHPTKVVGRELEEMVASRSLNGFLSCHIIPPRDLLIPFLPHRRKEDDRLVFDLEPMTGCWTTVDIYFALDQGYVIDKFYQGSHFDEQGYVGGVFKEYVDTFIAIKQQAKRDGNPTKYLIAKKCLNTLWGKFCEKLHIDMVTTVTSPREYYDLMNSSHLKQHTMKWIQLDEDIWMVRSDLDDRFTQTTGRYNPALGSFVLAHARRRLHEKMVEIGLDRVVYCDTDSIVFTWDMENEDRNPPLDAEGLGEWENEIDGWPTNYIKEFIGIGPKSYLEMYGDPSIQGHEFLLKYKGQ